MWPASGETLFLAAGGCHLRVHTGFPWGERGERARSLASPCAAWLTYVHLSLVRQGRALRQRLGYGRGTGGGARPGGGGRGGSRAAPGPGPPISPRPRRGSGPPGDPVRPSQLGDIGAGGAVRLSPARTPMTSAVTCATLLGSVPEPRRTPGSGLERVVSDGVNGGLLGRSPPPGPACWDFREAKSGCASDTCLLSRASVFASAGEGQRPNLRTERGLAGGS